MANSHCARNKISQIRFKQVKKNIKEAQMKLKEKEKLDLRVEASMVV